MEIKTYSTFLDEIIDLLPANVLKRYMIVRDDYAGYTKEFFTLVKDLWETFKRIGVIDRYTIYHKFGMYPTVNGVFGVYDYIYIPSKEDL